MVGTHGTCVIWSKGFPFWHLVNGVVGLKLEGVWVEGGKWRRQDKIWWPECSWKDIEIERDKTCWTINWVLTEGGQLPGTQSIFCKKDRVHGIYVGWKKPLPEP